MQRITVEESHRIPRLPLALVLENIRSMHNVGSIFRTADAFRVGEIWLCGYTPRPPHRDIHKTALGATETVPWRGAENGPSALEALRAQGYAIYAVEQVVGSLSLHEFSLPPDEKLALVFGNEVSGVSPESLALCAGGLEIPQFGAKHSLNVSVAAGIVLWETAGRRLAAGAHHNILP